MKSCLKSKMEESSKNVVRSLRKFIMFDLIRSGSWEGPFAAAFTRETQWIINSFCSGNTQGTPKHGYNIRIRAFETFPDKFNENCIFELSLRCSPRSFFAIPFLRLIPKKWSSLRNSLCLLNRSKILTTRHRSRWDFAEKRTGVGAHEIGLRCL